MVTPWETPTGLPSPILLVPRAHRGSPGTSSVLQAGFPVPTRVQREGWVSGLGKTVILVPEGQQAPLGSDKNRATKHPGSSRWFPCLELSLAFLSSHVERTLCLWACICSAISRLRARRVAEWSPRSKLLITGSGTRHLTAFLP